MNTFYPATTEKILHKGKNGNIYRLDGIEKCISLKDELNKDTYYQVQTISATDFSIENIENLINSVHSPKILEAYKTGTPEELANAGGLMWQPDLYNYAIESAIVSKLVAQDLATNNRSLAIVGGGHHAQHNSPFGFCALNTMAIATKVLTDTGKKVALIDLDTHYSNGCIDILREYQNVHVYSLWNQTLEKWKYYEPSDNIWHKKVTNSKDYFIKLQELIENVKTFKPDVIIYHLGLDILSSDRMGGVAGMTDEGLVKRDTYIRELLDILQTPTGIFFGGAYIDWSKGQEHAKRQREHITNLQVKLTNILCKS